METDFFLYSTLNLYASKRFSILYLTSFHVDKFYSNTILVDENLASEILNICVLFSHTLSVSFLPQHQTQRQRKQISQM